jgi:hypothetical protein
VQPALLKGSTSLVLEVRERQIENEEVVPVELPGGSLTYVQLRSELKDGSCFARLKRKGDGKEHVLLYLRIKVVE